MFLRGTCLVEAESISCSGILINGNSGYVLSHSSLLISYLEKSPVIFRKLCDFGQLTGDEIPAWSIHVTYEVGSEDDLKTDVITEKKKNAQQKLSRLNIRATTSGSTRDHTTTAGPSTTLIKCHGTVEAIWKSDRFSEALSALFPCGDNWKFHEGTGDKDSNSNLQRKESENSSEDPLSLSNQQSSNSQHICNPENISTLLPYFIVIKTNQTLDGTDEYILSKSRAKQWSIIGPERKLALGEALGVLGTPFGSLSPLVFMNSLAKGVVSNAAGLNDEIILTDARCIPGTEGAAVVIPESGGVLLGMVVAPLCWRSNEWIGLSICCRINEILHSFQQSFLHKVSIPAVEAFMEIYNPRNHHALKRLVNSTNPTMTGLGEGIDCVLVKNNETWGSGALIDNSLVITCSHVVKAAKRVKIRIDRAGFSIWQDADVVYATPLGKIYDLAVCVLSIKSERDRGWTEGNRPLNYRISDELNSENVSFNNREGDDVYMVGHAVFSAERNMLPSVTSGIISRVVHVSGKPAIVLTTCAVHSGASGGPLFNSDGKLVGIVVCNAKDTDSGASYPHVNLAVPVEVFWPKVLQYFSRGDSAVFKSLHCRNKGIQKLWSLENSCSTSEIESARPRAKL